MPLTKIQEDACSGIALMYMGPSTSSAYGSGADEHVDKLQAAMVGGDAAEAEHQSAIMLVKLVPKLSPESFEFASERWLKAFAPGDAQQR